MEVFLEMYLGVGVYDIVEVICKVWKFKVFREDLLISGNRIVIWVCDGSDMLVKRVIKIKLEVDLGDMFIRVNFFWCVLFIVLIFGYFEVVRVII